MFQTGDWEQKDRVSVYSGVTFSCSRHIKFTEAAVGCLIADLCDYFREKHGTPSTMWRNTINIIPAASHAGGCVLFSPTRTDAWILVRAPDDYQSDAYHLLQLLRSRFLPAVRRFSSGTMEHMTESITSCSSIRKEVAAQRKLPDLRSHTKESVELAMCEDTCATVCIGAGHDPDQAADLLHYPQDHVSVMTREGRKELISTVSEVQDVQQLADLLRIRVPTSRGSAQLSPLTVLEKKECSGVHCTTGALLEILDPARNNVLGVHAICTALRREHTRVSVCTIALSILCR